MQKAKEAYHKVKLNNHLTFNKKHEELSHETSSDQKDRFCSMPWRAVYENSVQLLKKRKSKYMVSGLFQWF